MVVNKSLRRVVRIYAYAARSRHLAPPRARLGVLNASPFRRIRTASLDIAYEESGPSGGAAVLLMHGWPYDPRRYDDVVPPPIAALEF
jgi:hypothetical protein